MRYKIICFLFFGTICLSFAQKNEISGVVTYDNMPLSGVNIRIENTEEGTVTDFDGNFKMQVNIGDILVFSYLGFQTQKVKIMNTNRLLVVLKRSSDELSEVMITTISTGYSTQELKKVSGAVSFVDGESVQRLKPVRVEESLQGTTSGVNVIAAGSPGAKPTIFIRGITSNKGNAPLVVIDGVSQTLDDMNALNPSDIAKIDVLKDASTAAIYGVAGGNGVIVITTKSGEKNQKMKLNYSSSYAIQEVTKFIRVLNSAEYATILNEASVNSGGDIIFNNIKDLKKGTNWQKELFKKAPIVNHNISVQGGTNASTYFLSVGYTDIQGVMGTQGKSKFNRTNLTGRFTIDLSDQFNVIVNTNYTNIEESGINELFNALNFDPTLPVRNKDGKYSISKTITQEVVNPLASMSNNYNSSDIHKLFGKLALQYEPIKNLKLTSRLGYVFANKKGKSFTPLQFYGVGHNKTNANEDLSPIVTVSEDETNSTYSSVSEDMTNWYNFNYEFFGNYKFLFQDDHLFNMVAGFSLGRSSAESVSAHAKDIPNNSWNFADVSAAKGDAKTQTSSSWQSVKRNLSFFGRMNYDFQGKYLASFTVRRDGSTSFGKNNKFGTFPSGSLGWIITKEEFFQIPMINFLKIRGSYGALGSDNISPQFPKISNFPKYTFSGVIKSGSKLDNIANDAVSWEHQIQINAGFDLKMFENALGLTVDFFQKEVSDLLFDPTLSPYLGTPTYPSSNVGSTRTRGIDVSLSYQKDIIENVNLVTSLNFTTAKNEVLKINNSDKFVWVGGYGIPYKNLSRFEEGEEPGYFYGHKTNGIFQNQAEIDAHAVQNGAQPGDIRFVDVNGDGRIDDEDRTKIGSPYPKFILGWNLNLQVYDFDFSLFTYSSIGADIYRAYERNLNYTNRFGSVVNRWRGEGTSNKEPRVTFVDNNNNNRPSDRYIEDGSFFKIKNIQLGYTIDKNLTGQIGIKKVRIYVQGKNVLVLTKYSGYDPEISSSIFDTGIDRGSYPIPRTILAGINVAF